MVDEKALERAYETLGRPDHAGDRLTVRAAITAYLQALPPGTTGETEGWREIESAPKDGTRVDLWMVDSEGNAFREPDAYWVDNELIDHFTPRRGRRSGWWAPNHDYDGADGWADKPERTDASGRVHFTRPTHWRPLPAPPSAMLSAAGERG